MADLDVRPLSLGELLDRTFSLYRRHFWVFIGIAGIPQIVLLAMRLAEMASFPQPKPVNSPLPRVHLFPAAISGPSWASALLFIASIVATVFAGGGTVYAASESCFGRTVSARASLWRVRRRVISLTGLWLLRYGGTILGLILLIVPGVYWACRTLSALPAALLENLGPADSLRRSWDLTKGFAWRAFTISLLYFVLWLAMNALSWLPFTLIAQHATENPEVARRWLELTRAGNSLAVAFATGFLGVAEYMFYFDLRVRKEALDLQLMVDPNAVAGVTDFTVMK